MISRRAVVLGAGGAALALPRAVRGEQKAIPVIGILGSTFAEPAAPFFVAFSQALAETGYIEGQTVAIEARWAEGRHYERLPGLAAGLVGRKVDVIVAAGPPGVHAAKNASSTIPIVFIYGGDPVAEGLVSSLARPGSNLTGVAIQITEATPKRLELLAELVPRARVIALLVNTNAQTQQIVRDAENAARTKGVRLLIVNASTEGEIDSAFATLVSMHADALIIGNDVLFTAQREQLVALASRYAVPTIDRFREFAASGGLISYGPSLTAAFRQAGVYAAKILNGAKPTDLPVVQPTKFKLVINLKTAKALGLTVPQSLLARADEVIE